MGRFVEGCQRILHGVWVLSLLLNTDGGQRSFMGAVTLVTISNLTDGRLDALLAT